jgi:nitrogen fixation NifU-like protein
MSNLDNLYREVVLDHYRSPRNRGSLPSPPAVKADGFNPLCGDEAHIWLIVDDGVISDIKIEGSGCSISQASASMMSAAIKGRNVEQALAMFDAFKLLMGVELEGPPHAGADTAKLGDLEALQGVSKFPVRIKCATLPWNTFLQALGDATGNPL